MKSTIVWMLMLELPDGGIHPCPVNSRDDAIQTLQRFRLLHPAIKHRLFKLKYVAGRLYVELKTIPLAAGLAEKKEARPAATAPDLVMAANEKSIRE